MGKYRIKMNGKIYEMEVELVDEKVEMQSSIVQNIPNISYKNADPVVRVVGPEAERKTLNSDAKVLSPMPGQVIKVIAKEGDNVVEGEPVIILEAMKMENEICAQKSGTIKEFFVTEGQTVPGAAPLFEMEE